ncbi:MAG: hypothetical protein LV480_11240 [Methylacidiphilales bacterium]|nr:hypothetical protein [Candidatus Methylacidiphilales bacterium]
MKGLFFLPALAALLALTATTARADNPVVPDGGFAASRYEALWTKSPFAVATSEEVADTSPDYFLVGIAGPFDGVSYASVVERQAPQDHFLISTDKPVKGLTLTSITVGHNGSDTYAVVQKDGQKLTLKLEQAPALAANPGAPPTPMQGIMIPQITMPGAGNPNSGSPFPRGIHRPLIHVPHMPPQPGQPVQVHPPPPSP